MQVLITGNGFDLFHKLPTKYIDFLKIARFISENESFDLHTIYMKLGANAHQNIFEHYNEFDLDLAAIKQLKDILQTNMWFNYLKNEFNKDATWIDLELEMVKVLERLDIEINKIQKAIIKNNLNNEFISLNYEYDEIIIDFEIYNFQDNQFFINAPFLLTNRYGYPKDINQEAIKEYLYKDFESLKKAFSLYLVIFIEPLFNNVKKNVLPHNIFENIQYNLTFNYTPTATKLYGLSTQHIHGKANLAFNNIVIGIDEKKNTNPVWMKFTKHHQKIYLDTDFNVFSNLRKRASFNMFHFYFIGHSLNESDKYYIDEIFHFLKQNNENMLCIFYHNLKNKASMLEKLMTYKNSTDIMKLYESGNIYFKPLTEESINNELNPVFNIIDNL